MENLRVLCSECNLEKGQALLNPSDPREACPVLFHSAFPGINPPLTLTLSPRGGRGEKKHRRHFVPNIFFLQVE